MVRVVRERAVLYVIFWGGYVLSDAEEGDSFPGDGVVLFPSDSKEDVVEETKYQETSAGRFPSLFFLLVSGPKEKTEAKRRILRFRL